MKIYTIESDTEILKEYFYLARHTAKIILGHLPNLERKSSRYSDVWFYSNQDELLFIGGITSEIIDRVSAITKRQETTLTEGRKQLITDMNNLKKRVFEK